jgi:hypothetical protein
MIYPLGIQQDMPLSLTLRIADWCSMMYVTGKMNYQRPYTSVSIEEDRMKVFKHGDPIFKDYGIGDTIYNVHHQLSAKILGVRDCSVLEKRRPLCDDCQTKGRLLVVETSEGSRDQWCNSLWEFNRES